MGQEASEKIANTSHVARFANEYLSENDSPRDRARTERLLQRYHERNKFAVLEIIALLPAQALPRVCKRNTSRHSLEDRLASWISSIAQSVSERD